MEELLDSIKRKPMVQKNNKTARDVEIEMKATQYKMEKIAKIETAKGTGNLTQDTIADNYLDYMSNKKDYLDGTEKFNRIDKDSYGKHWGKLTIEEREGLLDEYFETLALHYFMNEEDKTAKKNEALKRLSEKRLNSAKEIQYDRVNKRIVKLVDMKFDMENKRYYWNTVQKKVGRKTLLNKMLGIKK